MDHLQNAQGDENPGGQNPKPDVKIPSMPNAPMPKDNTSNVVDNTMPQPNSNVSPQPDFSTPNSDDLQNQYSKNPQPDFSMPTPPQDDVQTQDNQPQQPDFSMSTPPQDDVQTQDNQPPQPDFSMPTPPQDDVKAQDNQPQQPDFSMPASPQDNQPQQPDFSMPTPPQDDVKAQGNQQQQPDFSMPTPPQDDGQTQDNQPPQPDFSSSAPGEMEQMIEPEISGPEVDETSVEEKPMDFTEQTPDFQEDNQETMPDFSTPNLEGEKKQENFDQPNGFQQEPFVNDLSGGQFANSNPAEATFPQGSPMSDVIDATDSGPEGFSTQEEKPSENAGYVPEEYQQQTAQAMGPGPTPEDQLPQGGGTDDFNQNQEQFAQNPTQTNQQGEQTTSPLLIVGLVAGLIVIIAIIVIIILLIN